MADNAFVKIGTALLKHQVKKLVGEETLGVLSEELADIGGDKLDAWLGDKSTIEQIEQAATYAQDCFHDSVGDHELEQWMISLPVGNLPKVLDAVEKLPTSPDEKQLENALRNAIADWRKISPEQINKAVNAFMSCLRSALLPVGKQTLMVIGRSVLRTEDKVDLLLHWFEQYIITGKATEIKQLNPEPVETWNLKHPYAMPPNFTGRVDERKMLADWLNNDNENRLFILRALGGFGKSALSWHWLTHDVDSKEWTKLVWWSFYEGDASFEHFIEEALKYLKLEVPQGGRPQVDALLKAMQSQKILLIMDGFERVLRLYANINAAYQSDEEQKIEDTQLDCVNINAEFFLKGICSLPNIKSKVLMTTRLTPRAVKPRGEHMLGCREVELTSMQPADAVEFFHKQKIKGTHAEIEAACAPYGYHPLSLRLLAGRILKDFENPADIAVAKKLKIDGDIVQQKHHVLEVSYNSLPPHEQKLLSTIACFRSPVVIKTIEAISTSMKEEKPKGLSSLFKKGTSSSYSENIRNDLHDLVERGLLHFDDKNKKFDLHPIVRRYAYERLTMSDRIATHNHLRYFFAQTKVVEQPQVLDDLTPIFELYYHTLEAGEYDQAFQLLYDRLVPNPLHFQFGAYQLILELILALFPDGEDRPPKLNDDAKHAWLYNSLGNTYGTIGQPLHAERFSERYVLISQERSDTENVAIGLGNLGATQMSLGKLKKAESNLRRRIELCQEVGDKETAAIGHQELGRLLSYQGSWGEAIDTHKVGLALAKELENPQIVCVISAYRAERAIFMKNTKVAMQLAEGANTLAGISYPGLGVLPRDQIRSNWILGAALRSNRETLKAENNLSEALVQCRAINMIDYEAIILLDLARLRYDQKKTEEAKSLADEALLITERCGYVLQGADVNLFLAQYALEQEKNEEKAKAYAEEALKLATCDGPPYYYKVAYEEAERFLKDLGG